MAQLHRIESLAGDGRWAVTFQRDDHSEQTVVVQIAGERVTAAQASLPDGWTLDSDAFATLAAAILAVQLARANGPRAGALVDVDGGWDVMMGNIVLDGTTPTCTAHGPLGADGAEGAIFVCAECGARAAYAS